eukprot:scaffold7017_cov134-Cylindrotheca_fusiformis.AAC.30
MCQRSTCATIAWVLTLLQSLDRAMNLGFQDVEAAISFATTESQRGTSSTTTTTNPFFTFNTIASFVILALGDRAVRAHPDDSARVKPDAFWMKRVIHVKSGSKNLS